MGLFQALGFFLDIFLEKAVIIYIYTVYYLVICVVSPRKNSQHISQTSIRNPNLLFRNNKNNINQFEFLKKYIKLRVKMSILIFLRYNTGLSLRGRGQDFSPATMNIAPTFFWKYM